MNLTSGIQKRINELVNIVAEPSSFHSIFLPFAPWLTVDTSSSTLTVSSWKDCLTGAYFFTQSTKASQPLLQPVNNGFYELKFDGSDDWMDGNTAMLDFTKNQPGATVIIGMSQQNVSPPTSREVFFASVPSGNSRFNLSSAGNLTVRCQDAHGGATAFADTTGATSKQIVAASFGTSSTNVDVYRNNVSRLATTVGTSSSTFSNTSQLYMRLCRNNGSTYLDAALQGMVLYRDKISNAQIQRATDALNLFFNNWYY